MLKKLSVLFVTFWRGVMLSGEEEGGTKKDK